MVGGLEVVVVALFISVILIGMIFFGALSRRNKQTRSNLLEQVSLNNRSRLAPLVAIHNEILKIVQSNPNNAAVSVIGAELITESDLMIKQCQKILMSRDSILKSGLVREIDDRELILLKERQKNCTDPIENEEITKQISSIEADLSPVRFAHSSIQRIDNALSETERALTKMKDKLLVASMQGLEAEGLDDELRDSIMRLRSLSVSLQEANEINQPLS